MGRKLCRKAKTIGQNWCRCKETITLISIFDSFCSTLNGLKGSELNCNFVFSLFLFFLRRKEILSLQQHYSSQRAVSQYKVTLYVHKKRSCFDVSGSTSAVTAMKMFQDLFCICDDCRKGVKCLRLRKKKFWVGSGPPLALPLHPRHSAKPKPHVIMLRICSLIKRATLVFCWNVSHWRVCAYRKCAIITLHPDFVIFDWISKSITWRTRHKWSAIQRLNEAYQASCNSIFPVCVQPLLPIKHYRKRGN